MEECWVPRGYFIVRGQGKLLWKGAILAESESQKNLDKNVPAEGTSAKALRQE